MTTDIVAEREDQHLLRVADVAGERERARAEIERFRAHCEAAGIPGASQNLSKKWRLSQRAFTLPRVRISEVAKKLSVSAAWLRELEKAGRIPPATRDRNGHRRFTEDDIERLRGVLYGGDAGWCKEMGIRW